MTTNAKPTQKTHGFGAGLRGLWIYTRHVIGLVRPGRPIPTYLDPEQVTADLSKWSEDELGLLIDEGRRQYDAQTDSLEKVRGRAQWLFSTALALAGADAALATKVFPHPTHAQLAGWISSVVFTSWSALGAGAVITVTAKLEGVATAPLSGYTPPIKNQLAIDYAEILDVGEQTVNTRLTLYRQAVVWLMLGGYAALACLLLAQFSV